MHRTTVPATILAVLLLLSPTAFAQQPAPATTVRTLPAWDQLTPAEREALVTPLRERWNDADPAQRQRMLDHARRWKQMSPGERASARKGHHRWEHLSAEQREQARVLYRRMRDMSDEQRRALRKEWHSMTPAQRKAWLERNTPADGRPTDSPPRR